MRFVYASLAVIAWACIALGQDITIKGDVKTVEVDRVITIKEKVQVVSSLPFVLQAPTGGILYQWDFPAGVKANKRSSVLEITSAPKGALTVSVSWAVVDFAAMKIEEKSASLSFAVGEVAPAPKPPEPINVAPIPVDGFRVLFVVETADASKLPKEQLAILTSHDVRAYLNAKCVLGADGKTREWRQWDKDVSIEGEAAHWKAAMGRKRDSLPWLIISDGKTGYEGPLPMTIADTLKLLKQFAGE